MPKNGFFNARKKGFTLAELIITIGIILILSALVTPSVISLQRKLKSNEMDAYAKSIYQSAQSRLITLKGTGEIANISKTNSYDDKDDNPVYWLNTSNSSDMPSIKKLLPIGTVEETIRNSNYVIEYDPDTAMILSVYYFGDTTVLDTKLDSYRKNVNIRHLVKFGPYGYFKGGNVEARNVKRSDSLINPVIVNESELYAKIYLKKNNVVGYGELDNNGLIRVTLNGLSSGSHQLIIDDTAINTFDKYNDEIGNYIKISLDKLSDNASDRFINKFPSFTPGEDINIEVQYKDNNNSWSKKASSKAENSLFANVKVSYVKGIGNTAYIANSRHLQNLDPTFACLNVDGNEIFNKIEQVQIKNDITWSAYYSFNPIANKNLKTFEGNNNVIKNLTIDNNSVLSSISIINSDNASENVLGAGLFAYFKGSSFKNIDLDNIIISNPDNNITYIGGLIAYADSANSAYSKLKIDNCHVYSTSKTNLSADNQTNLFRIVANNSSTGLKAVGGLIGYTHNADIKNCSASYAKIDAQKTRNVYVGGFIGLAKDTSIDKSYSFFGFNNQGTWLENTGLIQNTSVNDRLAGFVGQFNNSKVDDSLNTVNHSFAIGVINSKDAYSFTYGSSTNNVRISNSYSMVVANVNNTVSEYGRFCNSSSNKIIFDENNPCFVVGDDSNKITGLNQVMLAQFATAEIKGFELADSRSTKTNTYGLPSQNFPYLIIENTDYYGDWPIATITEDPYEMVYYEVYKTDDKYSVGFYNKDLGIDSLMSNREEINTNSTLITDGYALLIKSDSTGKYFANEGVELTKVCNDLKKTHEILFINVRGLYLDGNTYDNSTFNIKELANSINASSISYRGDTALKSGNQLLMQGSSMYYPIFLGSNIINSTKTDNYYSRFGVHYFRSTGLLTYVTIDQNFLVNFNYAKSKIIKTDPSGTSKEIPETVSIRSERQFANFKNMSTKYPGMDFVQERDLYFDTESSNNTPLYYSSTYLNNKLTFGNSYSATQIPTNLANITLPTNSTYDGNNHMIYGQKFDGSKVSLLNDDSKGTVKNLIFDNCFSTGSGNNAILVSNINSSLSIQNVKFNNCFVSSTDETANSNIGILAGTLTDSNNKISNIEINNSTFNSASVPKNAGLAIGTVYNSSLDKINVKNDVTTVLTNDSETFGGLFGTLNNSKVTNSSFDGSIEASQHNVGLFVGILNNSLIETCSTSGSLAASINTTESSDSYSFGGFVGLIKGEKARIINSNTNVTIDEILLTNKYTGGFVGKVNDGKFIKCYVLGENKNTSDLDNNGGFVGSVKDNIPSTSFDFIDAVEVAYVISNAYDYSTIPSLAEDYINDDYLDVINSLKDAYTNLMSDTSSDNMNLYYLNKFNPELYYDLEPLRETRFDNLNKIIDNIGSNTVISSFDIPSNNIQTNEYINSPVWSLYNEIYRLVLDEDNEIDYKDSTYDYRRLLAYNFVISEDAIYTIPSNIYEDTDSTIVKFEYKEYLENLGDPSSYIKYLNDQTSTILSKVKDNSIVDYLLNIEENLSATFNDTVLNIFTYCGYKYDDLDDSKFNDLFIDFELNDSKYTGIKRFKELFEISGTSNFVNQLEEYFDTLGENDISPLNLFDEEENVESEEINNTLEEIESNTDESPTSTIDDSDNQSAKEQ